MPTGTCGRRSSRSRSRAARSSWRKKSWSDSLIKVEIGTAAPIDTVTFETQVAQNEQVLLAAQISWTTAELNFKRLLVSGTDDPLYREDDQPDGQAGADRRRAWTSRRR